MNTAFAEVESLMNGRALTYVSVDPAVPEPLTPNHLQCRSSQRAARLQGQTQLAGHLALAPLSAPHGGGNFGSPNFKDFR